MKKTSTPEATKQTVSVLEGNFRELKSKIILTLKEHLLSKKSSCHSIDWKTLLCKAKNLIYSKQEFYVHKSRVSLPSIVKLPRNIKIMIGNREDIELMNIDQ